MREVVCLLPRERSSQNAKVPLTVQTLVKSIEESPIEYLVETLQILDILPESQGMFLTEIDRHLDYDRFLLYFPEGIKNSVRDHHDVCF